MFGISLLLTLLIELGIAVALRLKKRELLIVLLANVFTNPAAVYISWAFDTGLLGQIVIETGVIAAEWLIYKVADRWGKYTFKRPFLYSVVMNVISYGVGLLIELTGRRL